MNENFVGANTKCLFTGASHNTMVSMVWSIIPTFPFSNDIVPVVLGARPEDYQVAAPPHSYIHVDDFPSPKHLARYLHKLHKNDHLYNSYFRWKSTPGRFVDTKFWCRLCSMVNLASEFPMWYQNVNDFWRGEGVCVKAEEKTWASWRGVKRSTQYTQSTRYGYRRHGGFGLE